MLVRRRRQCGEEASGSTSVTEDGDASAAAAASSSSFRSMRSTSSVTAAPGLPARWRHDAHRDATSMESSSVAARSRACRESGCVSTCGTGGYLPIFAAFEERATVAPKSRRPAASSLPREGDTRDGGAGLAVCHGSTARAYVRPYVRHLRMPQLPPGAVAAPMSLARSPSSLTPIL